MLNTLPGPHVRRQAVAAKYRKRSYRSRAQFTGNKNSSRIVEKSEKAPDFETAKHHTIQTEHIIKNKCKYPNNPEHTLSILSMGDRIPIRRLLMPQRRLTTNRKRKVVVNTL